MDNVAADRQHEHGLRRIVLLEQPEHPALVRLVGIDEPVQPAADEAAVAAEAGLRQDRALARAHARHRHRRRRRRTERRLRLRGNRAHGGEREQHCRPCKSVPSLKKMRAAGVMPSGFRRTRRIRGGIWFEHIRTDEVRQPRQMTSSSPSHAQEGRVRRVDLAQQLILTASGVTGLHSGLEQAGWVERASCA